MASFEDIKGKEKTSKSLTELVVATSNCHKLREYRQVFIDFPKDLDICSLRNFSDYVSPEETGETFEDNALLKAQHAAKVLNTWVIADDSGLVVPALKGKPGVRSARYAGEKATDAQNRDKLMQEMISLSGNERSGYFVCCIALAHPDGFTKYFEGICEGEILTEERGSNGFGYDSLFIKNSYTKTFAEMEESTKNRISHRRKALDKLFLYLETIVEK